MYMHGDGSVVLYGIIYCSEMLLPRACSDYNGELHCHTVDVACSVGLVIVDAR